MLSHERYAKIQEIVNEKGTVTVAELSKKLDTSESTIRRDLTALDELGKIKKFFGGATKVEITGRFSEETIRVKESLMNKEKTAIGKYAATLIGDDDFVFIDAGTTTSRMIDFIEKNNATYVTNGITHARKLLEKGLNVYIIGGKIKSMTEAIIGVEAIANLAKFNFSKAFLGVNGIDLKAGYTTPDIDEGLLKETAINQSNMVFVLADHSKFKKIYAKTFKELNQCCIITDSLPDPKYSQETVIKIVK